MKSISELIIFIFTFLALAASAYAQSPREQLQQMVEQLQKTPNDIALRERIIKLGQQVKPAPTIPDDAVRYTGRAMFVFKTAKNETDYLDAAREYERAVTSAPWVASYYTDLCTIYEKAGKYAEAKRACDFALFGTTNSSEAVDLKQRIAGLEIGIERSSPAAQLKRDQDDFAAFLRQNDGAIFNIAPSRDGNYFQAIIENGVVVMGMRYVNEKWLSLNPNHRGKLVSPTRYAVTGFSSSGPFICADPNYSCLKTLTFSRDGRTLTTSFLQPGATTPLVLSFSRAN